jgi:putative FmdB family regulatory protein
MPTYVYQCRSCDKSFEIDQRISEPALTDCSCGEAGTLRRLVQPTAILFKGSGFHVNDYSGKAEAKTTTACTGEPHACPACNTPGSATDVNAN